MAKRRQCLFYTAVGASMVITTAFELYITIALDRNADEILYDKIFDTCWYTIVTILYVVIIIYLIRQLNKIHESDLQREKKSIIKQFILFLIGYIAWTLYIIIEYFNESDNALFVDGIIHAVAIALWDIAPITYMLFVHHRTFRSMIKQLSLSAVDNAATHDMRLSSNVDEMAIKALLRDNASSKQSNVPSSPNTL